MWPTLTELLDLIAPRTCAVCGQRLSATETVLCAPCMLHMPLTGFETSPLDNPLARLFWGCFDVERAAALFHYHPHGVLSTLIYAVKYGGQPRLGQRLGYVAGCHMARSGFFDGIDLIVPVPLTWRRRWQRGYNQSLEIARGLSLATRLPVVDGAVRRTAFHGSQTHLSGWERRANVEAAFRLANARRIEGRHVLLVDDIITTGATITSCAQALCQARGVRVSVLSLGFTQ